MLFAFYANTQISVDSLLSKINSDYSIAGTNEYLGESFIKFELADKGDRYDLYLDSINQLNNHIGLSIVHYSFDELNRIKLIEGFDSTGVRSYWDFPVIQRFRYVADTVISEFNKIKNELCNCQGLDTLSLLVEITEINRNPIYNKTRLKVISRDSTMKLTYAFCSKGNLCKRRENVSFIFRVFDNENRSIIAHERYYDADLNLVDGLHNVSETETLSYYPSEEYAYSVRNLKKGELDTIRFYNKKGKLVDTKQYGFSSGPINVPK